MGPSGECKINVQRATAFAKANTRADYLRAEYLAERERSKGADLFQCYVALRAIKRMARAVRLLQETRRRIERHLCIVAIRALEKVKPCAHTH